MTTFLRLPDVMAKTGMARSTIYAAIEYGDFPKAVKLGERAVAWDSDEIERWMETKKEQRGKSNE